MGWRDNQYYYRSSRVNGQVKTEYVGAGYQAELLARLDEHERHQAKLRRRALAELKKREAALDKSLDEVGDLANSLVTALLLVTGHHTHKRQWRKARK